MSRSRQVVLVTTHYPPLVGGAATYFFLLAKSLVAADWQVTVLTTTASNQSSDAARGVRVCAWIPSLDFAPGSIRRWLQMIMTVKSLTWLRWRGQVDVIHTHASKSVTVGSGIASALWRIPIVFEVQDFLSRPRALRLGWRRKYIATGQPLAARLRSLGISDENVVSIPSIPPDEFRQPVRYGRSTPARVLFIGEFHRDIKGEDVLLEAFARLHRTIPEVRLVMVGDGPDRAADTALVADKKLESVVQLRGQLSPDKCRQEMDQARFLVVASHTEGMPRVILEAFARGLPVVATRVGGIPEVVHDGHNGLLVPPNDPAALAATMEKMLRDEAGQEAMGRAARDWIDTLPTWPELVKKITTVYPW